MPDFLNYLAVPANLEVLARRPWTLVTYMFLHLDFIHILFNLLWLYWFGTVFIQELGLKKLLSTYLLGGLAGGILYVIFYNLFNVFEGVRGESIALGASASVMAVVVAAAPFCTLSLTVTGVWVYCFFERGLHGQGCQTRTCVA